MTLTITPCYIFVIYTAVHTLSFIDFYPAGVTNVSLMDLLGGEKQE
jgi:hypothetical protein